MLGHEVGGDDDDDADVEGDDDDDDGALCSWAQMELPKYILVPQGTLYTFGVATRTRPPAATTFCGGCATLLGPVCRST